MAYSILFTGHMIDKPDRDRPRFPGSKEPAAAAAIRTTLGTILKAVGPRDPRGIAAAACGGDILFHEACLALKVPSEIYLAVPEQIFEQASVEFAGPGWVARYRQLIRQLPVHIMQPNAGPHPSDSIWEEANRWMFAGALAASSDQLTLIALWDSQQGDNPGGTTHLVHYARSQGVEVTIIDISQL